MENKIRFIAVAIFVTVLYTAGAQAQTPAARSACDPPPPGTRASTNVLALQVENDLFAGTDAQYTSGAKLTWVSPNLCTFDDAALSPWVRTSNRAVRDLVGWLHPQTASALNMVVTLGQAMYTPADRDRTDVDPGDRPYAGWTYLGLGYNARYDPARGGTATLDTVEIDIGIVGPHSYAKETQGVIHRMRGLRRFLGWDNQLHDEPGLQIVVERKLRPPALDWKAELGAEFIPHYGLSVGNVASYLNVGGEARFGWRLPDDFGTSSIRPGGDNAAPRNAATGEQFERLYNRRSFHFFASFDGRLVANNIFLDGNTFARSHAVKKKLLVGDIAYGWAYTWPPFNGLPSGKLAYSHYVQSREFDGEARNHGFGSISLSLEF
ncbi:MAG: lipid A deacylase LpxR family protein [Betaproteobacteria bacterium]